MPQVREGCFKINEQGMDVSPVNISNSIMGLYRAYYVTMVNTVLLSCARKTPCSKIQLIPAFVCKKHEEIMKLYTNGQSDTDSLANCTIMNKRGMSKFDRESDKIWPPADRAFSYVSALLIRTAFMVA